MLLQIRPDLLALRISPVDAAIVVVYLVILTGIGFWIGRGNRTVSDYLLGDRSLPWWAVLGSIVATETSTATFLSVPGTAFAEGGNLQFLQLVLGFCLGRVCVAAYLIPLYFEGKLFTAYEVLHKRFGGVTQKTASLIFLVTRNLGDGLRLLLAGIVVEKVSGIGLPQSIMIVGVCTIAYTFVGGMKAVIWSDCIQFLIYVGGGLAALILIIRMLPGGWSELMSWAAGHNKLAFFDSGIDPSRTSSLFINFTKANTLLAGLIGGTLLSLGTHGTDQMMVQRYLCTGSQRGAAKAVVLSGLVVFIQFALFLILGFALAAFYAGQPQSPVFDRSDEVFATFIVQEMPVGLVGLMLAAVFSAAMSTLSSSLNSSAGAVVNDFLKHFGTPRTQLRLSRMLTLAFGAIQISLAIFAIQLERSVIDNALAIAGFSSGILVGVFALGVLSKRVGQISAMIGMLEGTMILCMVKFWTPIAWPWYAPIGAAATIGFAMISSLAFDSGQHKTDSRRRI
jgi:solute:Na+ symporter, SSS family